MSKLANPALLLNASAHCTVPVGPPMARWESSFVRCPCLLRTQFRGKMAVLLLRNTPTPQRCPMDARNRDTIGATALALRDHIRDVAGLPAGDGPAAGGPVRLGPGAGRRGRAVAG